MAETVRRVRPTPTDEYLGNPHKGCCTFQHFNGDEPFPGTGWSEEGPVTFPLPAAAKLSDRWAGRNVAGGYLPSTVSYCRWFWRIMEPEKGRYDFSMIDGALDMCRQRGQTLAVRLMAYGSQQQPRVPDWYAARCPMVERKVKSAVWKVPVHDAPEYLEHWGGFVQEFARRYDKNPTLESIDVTYIGPWGEGDGECSVEQCRRFADVWKRAFTRTPRLCMVGGDQMRAGIASGSGWRCDCYGDLRAVGDHDVPRHLSWNHMYEAYPPEVIAGGATDAWKTGPVHFEACWVPMAWYQNGYDIDFILEQGLKYHGTYFMPKYTRMPEVWMEKLERFCRTLGYRFVYRIALFDRQVKRGGSLHIKSWIENVGVAPIYQRYDLAFRFRQGDHEAVVPLKDIDIRTWLPGDFWLDRNIPLPEGFKPGCAELAAALVDPATQEAKVSFAVKEVFPDRWVDLNGIEIV
ncbi:MAG: DUF4832 domain-containing protein [Planctomycetota bacterium]|nr:DUF4832 domain-containing protein [Planctomycetota bacterium]